MKGLDLVSLVDGELCVDGNMTFATVNKLWEQSRPLLQRVSAITVNLTGATNCDSAGLALLIEWKRLAEKDKKSIQFKNTPDQLLKIAEISGLSGFFFT